MNIFKLAYKSLIERKLHAFLCVLLLSLGIGMISFLIHISAQLEEKFTKNISGIDMVVGAKGSPLQIILAAVYQADAPTGNIKLADFQKIAENPMVKTAIPLSLGDNIAGFRIVGTNRTYIEHFKGVLASGNIFKKPMDAVLGSETAKTLQLKVNAHIEAAHGLDPDGEHHEDQHFNVVGILKPSGTVLDHLVLTPLSSIWAMHHQPMGDSASITAGLLKFRNKMGVVMLPRQINAQANLQAASPAIELNRLTAMLGLGISTLKGIAWAIMLVAAISVFVALYNLLKDKKYELALMLSMGASRAKLFIYMLLQAAILSIVSFIVGIGLSRIGLMLSSKLTASRFHFDLANWTFLPAEGILGLLALAIGLFAAAIPSLNIYKIDISKTLASQNT